MVRCWALGKPLLIPPRCAELDESTPWASSLKPDGFMNDKDDSEEQGASFPAAPSETVQQFNRKSVGVLMLSTFFMLSSIFLLFFPLLPFRPYAAAPRFDLQLVAQGRCSSLTGMTHCSQPLSRPYRVRQCKGQRQRKRLKQT